MTILQGISGWFSTGLAIQQKVGYYLGLAKGLEVTIQKSFSGTFLSTGILTSPLTLSTRGTKPPKKSKKRERNLVAKHARKFNRASVHRDRTKYHRPSERRDDEE